MSVPHPSPQQLAAFDAGCLPVEDREAVERHIADCPGCCVALETLPEDSLAALLHAYSHPAEGTGPMAESPSRWGVPDELVGHPRYRVLGEVGRGGMGVVYKAIHLRLDRVVALKIIHPGLMARPGLAERFRLEARAVARLDHEHIATAHDSDEAAGLHFLVMEFVEGESLEQRVRRLGPLPVAEACDCIRQAAGGLQHAHEQGLVHRDIKPSNLLLTPRGAVKIVDFGLARLSSAEFPPGTSSPAVLGTPDYISPEQAGDPACTDARSDLYSLGCTLYFLLTGLPPFPGGSALQKLLDHRERPPRRVGEIRPEVPAAVVELLDRLLAKPPAKRPATAAEVVRELTPGTSPAIESARRGRRWMPAAALLLLGAAAVGLAAWPRGPGKDDTEPEKPAPFAAPTPVTGAAVLPVSPPSPKETDTAEPGKGAGGRAIDWLRANNRWGPNADIVAQTAKSIDGRAGRSDGFQLTLGSGLMKSGRPTIVAVRSGRFFSFELDIPANRKLAIAERHYYLRKFPEAKEARAAKPTVELSDLKIENADGLPRGKRIRGTVAYHRTGTFGDSAHLRMVHYPGTVRTTGMFYLRSRGRAERGTIAFDFGAIDEKHAKKGVPLVAFLEWASEAEKKTTIDSNMLAAVVWMGE